MRLRFDEKRLLIAALCSVIAICSGLISGIEVLAQTPPITLAPVITTAAGAATVCQMYGLAVDAAGKVYIAHTYNHRFRRVEVTTSTTTTIAGIGSGDFSGAGGPAISAAVNSPSEVAVDAAGNDYIADRGNYRLRKINISGTLVRSTTVTLTVE